MTINEILEAAATVIEAKAQDEEERLKSMSGFAIQYDSGDLSYARVKTLREAANMVRNQAGFEFDGNEELVPMCESLKQYGRCPD